MAVKAAPFAAVVLKLPICGSATPPSSSALAEGHALTIERDRGWSTLDENDEPLTRRTMTRTPHRSGSWSPAARTTQVETPVGTDAVRPRESRTAQSTRSPGPIAPAFPRTRFAELGPAISAAALWLLAAGSWEFFSSGSPFTWPEQFGLIAGMLGAVVIGSWWICLAGWGAARLAWLGRLLIRRAALMGRE